MAIIIHQCVIKIKACVYNTEKWHTVYFRGNWGHFLWPPFVYTHLYLDLESLLMCVLHRVIRSNSTYIFVPSNDYYGPNYIPYSETAYMIYDNNIEDIWSVIMELCSLGAIFPIPYMYVDQLSRLFYTGDGGGTHTLHVGGCAPCTYIYKRDI